MLCYTNYWGLNAITTQTFQPFNASLLLIMLLVSNDKGYNNTAKPVNNIVLSAHIAIQITFHWCNEKQKK